MDSPGSQAPAPALFWIVQVVGDLAKPCYQGLEPLLGR